MIASVGDGGVYGAAIGFCWTITLLQSRWREGMAKLLIVCLFSIVLYQTSRSNHTWLRYATQLGGMIVTQSVLFHLFGVPKWRWAFDKSTADLQPVEQTRQFGIVDVMLVTLAYGCLMGLARHYLPRASLDVYWPTAIFFSLFFPMLATIVALSVRLGYTRHRFARLVLLCILVSLGATTVGWIESRMFSLDFDQAKFLFLLYVLFSVGFVIAMGFFAIAGVLGSISRRSELPSDR